MSFLLNNNGRFLMVEGAVPPTPSDDYVCFTAKEPNVLISLVSNGTPPTVTLEYSFDKLVWYPLSINSTTVPLNNIGDKVYFRGDNDAFAYKSSNNTNVNDYHYFNILGGAVSLSGNISTLRNKTRVRGITTDCTYAQLFRNCANITECTLSLPEIIPANTVGTYNRLFFGTRIATYIYSSPNAFVDVSTDGIPQIYTTYCFAQNAGFEDFTFDCPKVYSTNSYTFSNNSNLTTLRFTEQAEIIYMSQSYFRNITDLYLTTNAQLEYFNWDWNLDNITIHTPEGE